MKKFFKAIFILILLGLVFFKIFPRVGLYTFIFDRGSYERIDSVPDEIISDLDQLTPKTKEVAEKFLYACQVQGLDVRITETYRSQERQDWLYDQGRSRDGNIVTWTRHSRHTDRYAFDICKAGPDPYGDEEFFRSCAEIGRDLGLNAGYFWTGYQDMAHFQLDTWWNH